MVLRQADADDGGFTFFSRQYRIWIRLAGLVALIFALCGLCAFDHPILAALLWLVAFFAILLASWLAKDRFELTVRRQEQKVTILNAIGFLPAKRISFGSEEIAFVEFGPCRQGLQFIRFVWRDSSFQTITAEIRSAGDFEGNLAASVRKSLAALAIEIRNSG